jgi:hypothetical protein
LQQQKQMPLHQQEYIKEKIPEKIHIPNKKRMKKTSQQ